MSDKDDLEILDKLRIRGRQRAAIVPQLTLMIILLKKVSKFITKITLAVRKKRIKNPNGFIIIRRPKVPKFIIYLVRKNEGVIGLYRLIASISLPNCRESFPLRQSKPDFIPPAISRLLQFRANSFPLNTIRPGNVNPSPSNGIL